MISDRTARRSGYRRRRRNLRLLCPRLRHHR